MSPDAFRATLERQGLRLDERDRAAALETARYLEGAEGRLRQAARDRAADDTR